MFPSSGSHAPDHRISNQWVARGRIYDAWLHRLLVNACCRESRRGGQWAANVRALPVDGPSAPGEYNSDALVRTFFSTMHLLPGGPTGTSAP